MVFQNYALYPHLTVRANLGFGLKLRKTAKPEIARRVDDVARILGLEEMMERKPGELSGGQRQRVAMGRAIVREPRGVPDGRAAVATSTPSCASRCARSSRACTSGSA